MKMIKNLVLLSAVAASTVALAAQPGFYAGATIGYSMAKPKTISSVSSYDKNGVAYGVQGGYNFDQYFGVEVAYNHNAEIKAKDSAGATLDKVKFYDIDVLANGYLPVANNIDLVGKAGLAYVNAKSDLAVFNGGKDESSYRPKLALGVDYMLQPNMQLQATYSRIFKTGKVGDSKYVPNIDMLAVSFNYSFGGGNSNSDMM